jgi:hypothetical protein
MNDPRRLVRELHEKTASPLLAIARAFLLQKRANVQIKPQGALRNTMSVAYAATPPKPKSTIPKGPNAVKPSPSGVRVTLPSKARFYNDQSKANMGYSGNRMGVPNG